MNATEKRRAMDAVEKRNRLEERARMCFGIFSDATAEQRAWEHLTERERQGWRDVAAFDEPPVRYSVRREVETIKH